MFIEQNVGRCSRQHLRKTWFLPLCMALGMLFTVAQALAQDLTVSNIEVTQATQTSSNTITLVAQRSTAVRATITVTGSAVPVPNVSGRLHVFVAGVEITPLIGVPAINAPFTAPLAPQRANENDTLNFELPAPTGIGASTMVTFEVDLTAPSATTHSLTTSNLTFVNRLTPLLFYTSLDYPASGGANLPDINLIKPGVGNAFVKGIVPANDADPLLYRQGIFASLPWSTDINTHVNDVLNFLESCRHLIVSSGFGANDRVFLYGWVKGNPITGNGWSIVGGRVAFGNTDPIRHQRSYAHELTHNFGFMHNSDHLDQVGWDVGARLVNNPSTNNVPGRVKPLSLFDIQTPGLLSNQAWIETSNYNNLLNSPTLISPDAAGDAIRSAMIIRGIFDPTGGRLIQLNPVFRYPWLSQATYRNPQERAPFLVQVLEVTGRITNWPFNALTADDPDRGPEHEQYGVFEVTVPISGQVSAIRIMDGAGQISYGGFERLQRVPQIQITMPRRGETLGRIPSVKWVVDAPGAQQLMYQAAYSWDNGQSFVPIGVELIDTTLMFDTTKVPPSQGTGLIRVFVSDGLNTAFADVGGLSTLSTVSGTVTLQGCIAASIAAQPITFQLRPTDGSPPTTLVQNLNADGTFLLQGIQPGAYNLAIKGAKWLQKVVPIDASGGNVSGVTATLLAGDANNDNAITTADYLLLKASFGATPADPNWNGGVADFNCDGVVSTADYLLLKANFGRAGDP